jgi:outer membrane protein
VIGTAIALFAAGTEVASPLAVATDGAIPRAATAPDDQRPTSRWFVRAGVVRALYNSGARITTDGNIIPDSTVGVPDSTTVTVDVGYDLSDNVSVMFMGGIPPSVDVIGKGSVSSFGKLGHVRIGPAVITAVYRLPAWKGFRPYAGAGAAHLFILKTEDGSVEKLKVHDHNGVVLQAGVEYRLSRKWELFADYKHVWLNVRARGFLAGEPIRAKVTLNPDFVSAGVKFHFG